MADQAAKDAAAKQRIITHMNNDHHDSVIRYLENYHGLSSWQAHAGRISDIDLHSLTMTCRGRTYRTPFDPPMTSYREARERVVAMDHACLSALGRSDLTVRSFRAPTGVWAALALAIIAVFVAFSRRSWFGREGLVARMLGTGTADFLWYVQPWVLLVMVGAHSVETLYFIRHRLVRHSISPLSSTWWKWVVFVWLDGFVAFKTFDELVEQLRVEKEKQKH